MRVTFGKHTGALVITNDSAILSTTTRDALKLNEIITILGTSWQVVGLNPSLYIPNVVNISLRKENI